MKPCIQLSGTANKQSCSEVRQPGNFKVLEGRSQFDAAVIFVNTQIPPSSANENQRFSEMKKKSPCTTFKGMGCVYG